MKRVAPILLFVFLALTPLFADEEKPIHVTGILSLETFPGPPNFESIKDGDERCDVWVLTVTSGKKKDAYQLVVRAEGSEVKYAFLRKLKGKNITVGGIVFEQATGYHFTPLLIVVDSIKEERG